MDLKSEYVDDGSSFQEIDPLLLNPEYLTNFSIFEKYPHIDKKFRFRCLIADAKSMPVDKLIRMLQSWDTVYVHKKQIKAYEEHIKTNIGYILNHRSININKKTTVYIKVSTSMIKDVFESHFNEAAVNSQPIEQVEKLISKVIDFIRSADSLNGLAQLIGHDYDTHMHSIKVGWLIAVFINANRDLFPEQTDSQFQTFLIQAAVAGLLHDLGKIKIPENILNKRGKLDNLEYITVQSHAAYSLSLLFGTGLPKFAMQAILYHHENEDGSGYPCGLKNEQIPLIAKITHIADVFEALTSKRPYKEAKTAFEALKIMSGTNPHVEILNKFEQEAKENKRVPIEAIVRNESDIKLQRLRERQIMEEEAKKRVEARLKLRDQGMAHCFNKELIQRFIQTLNQSNNFNLTGLISDAR